MSGLCIPGRGRTRSGSVAVVRGAVSAVDGAAVDLLEGSDSDVLAEVDEPGDRGGADVEPVLVVRSELLAGSGLDDVDPSGHLELTWEGGGVAERQRAHSQTGAGSVCAVKTLSNDSLNVFLA